MGLLDELKARDVYRPGHWELKSGRHADVFLQVAPAMGDTAFARRLGRQLADAVRDLDVDVVVAPGVSSMTLAVMVADALAARMVFFEEGQRGLGLRRGQRVDAGARVLVVEDVLTTGRTADAISAQLESAGADVVGFATLVDRSTPDHPLPWPAYSLVHVGLHTHAAEDCPQCADGLPVEDPSA